MKHSNNNWGIKRFLYGLLIITIMMALGKWTYLFLPKEYAEKAQVPTMMEVILVVCVTYCLVEIIRLNQKIKEITKKLKDEQQ